MSAPWAIGWIRYGVATVLSTISGTPFVVGDRRDAGDVEDVDLRVGDGLAEERLGVGPHGRPPRIQVVGVLDEADLDAELGQRVVEQVVRAAVEPRAGHDVVAGVGEVEDRERLGGLTGGQEQRRDPAFERGDALLDDVLGRVHDPGVDVAGLGEAEQRGGVLGAVERVRRGLVDRQGPRVGGGVGRLAGVDLLGLERPFGGGICLACSSECPPSVSLGARPQRTRACRVAVRFDSAATQPGHHPGHPTAVGGLPASKPGLDAGAHDRQKAYRMAGHACQLADHEPDSVAESAVRAWGKMSLYVGTRRFVFDAILIADTDAGRANT